jgi:hypothetical protein
MRDLLSACARQLMCVLCTAVQLSFASMHITSHSALNYLPPTVYATFRIGMAVPLLFLSAGIQVSQNNSQIQQSVPLIDGAHARRCIAPLHADMRYLHRCSS